jgi:hypothetical protein
MTANMIADLPCRRSDAPAKPLSRGRARQVSARTSRAASLHTRTAVSPSAVLVLRAWARANLWECGEFDLPSAVDPLWDFAEEHGLVAELGSDQVQELIAHEFEAVRE